ESNCQALLVLEPENIAWLTCGASFAGNIDPDGWPALFFTADERWLIAANVDTQRLFDEELGGLGFQLKEWPWHWGREQLVADLCQGRKVACDWLHKDFLYAGEQLRQRRRVLSMYEQACLRSLGQLVSHALEATCRGLVSGQTERE